MMLKESICMQCSGTFSVAARCDRPQPAGKRGGSMILSIGFRCEISRLNSTPIQPSFIPYPESRSYPTDTSPSFPLLLLLQFLSFFSSLSSVHFLRFSRLLAFLREVEQKRKHPHCVDGQSNCSTANSLFCGLFEVIRLLTSLISPIPQFNCKETVRLSLCASPEFTTNLSSFSKTRSLCR
jgi:hypothetical protein